MSAYDGPAADPATVSALAATLRRRSSRLRAAAQEAAEDEPRLAQRVADLGTTLAAMEELAPALQTHATVLSDTRPSPDDDVDRLTLREARRRADAAALCRVLSLVEARIRGWDAGPPRPPA